MIQPFDATMNKLIWMFLAAFTIISYCNASEVIRIRIDFGEIAADDYKFNIYINGVIEPNSGDSYFSLSQRVRIEFSDRFIYIENVDDLLLVLDRIQNGEVDEDWLVSGLFSVRRLDNNYILKRETIARTDSLLMSKNDALLLNDLIKKMVAFPKKSNVLLY